MNQLMALPLILVALLLSLPAQATPKLADSDTSVEIASEDQDYKYYLAVSDDSETIKAGMMEAFEQAVQEAIRENYGFVTQIKTDSYSSTSENQVLKDFRQQSGEISLKGFEKVEAKVNKNSKTGHYQVRALYRYDKKEIARELARIKNHSPTPEALSVAGLIDNQELGGLKVTTTPPQANIYLNDQPYLRSPIEIINQIQPGKYILKIDHPYFETIEQEVIIRSNETTKVSKILKPAHGSLSINSTPDGAQVKIDGHKIGKTPISDYRLLAGKAVRIDIEQDDALPMSLYSYVIDKDQKRTEQINLNMKPGSVVLTANRREFEVKINGEQQVTGKRSFRLPVGVYNFTITANSYVTQTRSVDIKANKTIAEHFELDLYQMPIENRPDPIKEWIQHSLYFEKENYYFTVMGYYQGLSSPIKSTSESLENTNSAVASNGLSNSSYSLQVAVGSDKGFGLSYEVGKLDRTGSSSSLNGSGYYISAANQKRWGVSWSLDPTSTRRLLFSYEQETLQADISTFSSTNSYSSPTYTYANAEIRGSGFFVNWFARDAKNLFTVRAGLMDYTSSNNKNFKGAQSIYIGVGLGFDLLK